MTFQGWDLCENAMQKLMRHQKPNKNNAISAFGHSFCDVEELADTFRLEATQLSHATGVGRISGLTTGAVSLGHVNLPQETIVKTELDRNSVHFTLPLNSGEQWQINGTFGRQSSLFFNTDVDETYIYTKHRSSMFGHVRKDRFLDVLGALLGKDRDAVSLPSGVIELAPYQRQELISQMRSWILVDQFEGNSTLLCAHTESFESDIAHLLASAVIRYRSEAASNTLANRTCVDLVRNAEALFEERGSMKIGLADLCSAANVSAPTLIAAFRDVTGTTPMRFFKLKRLMRVRNELLLGRASVIAIKQAGLKHGFTQLGRMSVLYRSVYGEMPSQTLASI
jgi:AraC-like DNA-binding protein